MNARSRFGDFVLDTASRQLLRGGEPVPLSSRYFDALALLVRERGRLVAKQRFFDEVWAGSVVTDAALTQCIKEIRRALGDDAGDPRYVRTVPGHGYSFIAALGEDEAGAGEAAPAEPTSPALVSLPAPVLPQLLADTAAATAGGAAAGFLGGLLYGSLLAFAPRAQGVGSSSVLLVMLSLSVLIGMGGAFGVGLGLSAGRLLGRSSGWAVAGAAMGGFLIGGSFKLVGSDTLMLFVGRAPAGTTGGFEGLVIGLVFAAAFLYGRRQPVRSAALATGAAGALLSLGGGGLMAASLARMVAAFEQSRLDLAPLGQLFGEAQLGTLAQAGLGALEGGIFGACVAAALQFHARKAVLSTSS